MITYFFNDNTLLNYYNFINTINDNSSEEIFNKLNSYNTHPTKHIALCMDFFFIDGNHKLNIYDQIKELSDLKKKFNNVDYFISINPNRNKEEIIKLLNIAKDNNCIGFKLYPSLGYLPSHPNLINIVYPFCIANNWPITTHCSSASVHASAKKMQIIGLDINGNEINTIKKFKNKEAYRQLNNPQNYIPVFKIFPNLYLNFAHFGGDEFDKLNSNNRSWITDIIDLINKYDNIYTDISYTFSNQHYLNEMINCINTNEKLLNRTLYGTDYYMVLIEGSYRDLLTKLHLKLGDKLLYKLGVENTNAFINMKNT